MKFLFGLFLTGVTIFCSAQSPIRIDKAFLSWKNGNDGYICIGLPDANSVAPARFGDLPYFSMFNVPFQFAEGRNCMATTEKGKESLAVNIPQNVTELLFVMDAAFPENEKTAGWDYVAPLDLLTESERCDVILEYSDGTSSQLIPVNAGLRQYGISKGTALYSVTPDADKEIVKFTFNDKMANAGFQLIAMTANTRISPVIGVPDENNWWYPATSKVKPQAVNFGFEQTVGKPLTWGKIESAMLPGNEINWSSKSIFTYLVDGTKLQSADFSIEKVEKTGSGSKIKAAYNKNGISLLAGLSVIKSAENEVTISLEITNNSTQAIDGQLFFPAITDCKIGSASDTWYAYARTALIIGKNNCQFRDYLGSEKPLQFDGVFNPQAGVGLAFLPRDTTDMFRFYHFSKNGNGVSYTLEFTSQKLNAGQTIKSIPFALAVVPGDWKDQYQVYKNWVASWRKKITPELDWFRNVFAFVYTDVDTEGAPDFKEVINGFKTRFGYVDYFHIFGWANTRQYGHFGDYSHYESVGGKDKFAADIKYIQEKMGIPVGLYLDGYLFGKDATGISEDQKNKWNIIEKSGQQLSEYDGHVMCLNVKDWRDYLVSRYKDVVKNINPRGLYCDELGMSLRQRACYSAEHGHDVPLNQGNQENRLMKELKLQFPDRAVYTEFGGTEVSTQYADGSLSYNTQWGYYPPEWGSVVAHEPNRLIAPHYLDLRRFTCPDFKTFETAMTQTKWENGNWFMGKFPFFNGNSYFHRADVGVGADPEALEMFRKIRFIQNAHKPEFTSIDVEPMVTSYFKNTFVNRFSTPKCSVYTVYNANYRTVSDVIFRVKHQEGMTYKNSWDNKPVTVAKVEDGFDYLSFEIAPRDVACIVAE